MDDANRFAAAAHRSRVVLSCGLVLSPSVDERGTAVPGEDPVCHTCPHDLSSAQGHMADAVHTFEVQIYYEDTDFSGVVYHANYLRFFERAREHFLGAGELVRMWRETNTGFVVYRATQAFKEGAVFGDVLEIRSSARLESEYRIVFEQRAHRKSDGRLLVDALIEMVCIDGARRPVPIPLLAKLEAMLKK